MSKTGVGELLTKAVSFDVKNVTKTSDAAHWLKQFNSILGDLDKARDKDPIKSNSKTKKWMDELIMQMMRDASFLEKVHEGILLYNETDKTWTLASQQQEQSAMQLKSLSSAWPKLTANTRKQILALAKANK